MPNRPLNLIEQGNLLMSIRRDITRMCLQLERLMEHLALPPVTEEEVDEALSEESDVDDGSGFDGHDLP